MQEITNACKILENLKRRDQLEKYGINGWIILKWTLKKEGVRRRTLIHGISLIGVRK
jgi:hypothetical protein